MKKNLISTIKTALISTLIMTLTMTVYTTVYSRYVQVELPVTSGVASIGEEVRQIQTRLKELGLYGGSVDGVYSLQTADAVRRFQLYKGIPANGIADPQTLYALKISAGETSLNYSKSEMLSCYISRNFRGEVYMVKLAAAAVVLNRIKSPAYPDTLSAVIYQLDNGFTMDENSADEVTVRAVKAALNGADPTGGALHFFKAGDTAITDHKQMYIFGGMVFTD